MRLPAFHLLVLGVLLSPGSGNPVEARSGQTIEESRHHWAYQPIQPPDAPRVHASNRVQTPIDAFLLARLEAGGLTFSPPANPRALLRRVTYDLIGLPPTYAEIRAFEGDPSPSNYRAIVDRLLDDPRYGERWGRHWLDVARYADTKDLVLLYGTDAVRPYAYTYRDYVIRALNQDLPYDEFVRDQIAADLVTPPLPRWRLAGLGFLTLGRLFDENVHDQIDDQIDTVSRGLLGLTVACARCHDHKYDAISADDYYGLYGVFASTERPDLPPLIEDPGDVPGGVEFEAKLARAVGTLEDHIDEQYQSLTQTLQSRVGEYLTRAATTRPDITETTQFALSLTPDDFRPALMRRARQLLDRRLQTPDRVFGLWAELLALPDEDFASRSADVCALADASAEGAPDRNRLVTARFASAHLETKADIPKVFTSLLRDRDLELKGRVCRDANLVESQDARELTEIIRGPESPVWFARRDTPDHMSRPAKDRYNSLVLDLDKIAAHASNAPPARAMVVRDLPQPYEPKVFVRGNPSRPGRAVPRAFVRVLTGGEPRPFGAGSGRLELARAITDPANPLTARVIVNRIWMEHFGEPLVTSTADFGVRSEPPTHPDLLDWLASEFMRSGWRFKHLHRLIVLSAAYQQGEPMPDTTLARSDSGETAKDDSALTGARVMPDAVDPLNRLLWHYPRRRLDFEAMRDSLLVASGRLDPTMGGRPVDIAGDPSNRRRTVYGLVDRQNLPSLYRAFDFAVPDQCIERRPLTTVPQQALFAMNSPFVIQQARSLVAMAGFAGEEDARKRIESLFERVLARGAAERDVEVALRFIDAATASNTGAALDPWEQLAQVLLISNEAIFLD